MSKPVFRAAASKWKNANARKAVKDWTGKPRFFHSVGFKLFTTFFASIVALVLLVGVFSYTYARNMLEDNVSAASLQSMILTGDKIDSTLLRYESLTTQILLETEINERVKELLSATDDQARLAAGQLLSQRLEARLFADPDMAGVTLYTLQGNQFLHLGNASSSVQYVAGETWFRNAVMNKGKTAWSASTTGGTPMVTMTRQISDPLTGNSMYVIQMEMKSEALAKQLAGVKLGESGGLKRVIRDDLSIVASSEMTEVGKHADLEMPETLEASGSFNDKVQGEQMVVMYSSLTSVEGWMVVGSFSAEELAAQADTIFNVVLIAVILAAALAVTIGWFIVRKVARPLMQMTALMNEGERGNLTVRSTITGKDEIGRLSMSFNVMMENITTLVHRTNDSAVRVLETAQELAEASKMTARAAKEISTATEEIAGGATTLAVEAERGQSLTDMISERVVRTIHVNAEMSESAEEVSQASGRGTEAMKALIVQTGETEDLTRSLVEKVGKLGDSAKAVDKITVLLNDITKQTNVLSLNATIEASRAGAAGRGFMVVADEIRKLAEQSKQSIQTVSQMAKQIQAEVGETVDALSAVYPMFRQQAVSVQEANSIFGKVQLRMNELAGKLSEVTESVQELEHTQHQLSETMSGVSAVAQQSSASSEEVASLGSEQLSVSGNLVDLADNLQELSTDLKRILESFKF
ncbi:methyl-accepting chemotaxis protein [Paenibacillus phyllosphaerae]|uniref:Methyl-accepting chemotaxis protein n=1 Tax=Paenibacillus phyllosphaerae TaxID=274593 RepID=A0A7W5B1C3_9BACL|nr:methyl-accepting chemotaxis protein [Paenibacillus phyllosphaerae]MBB3112314.1 methyl-accepting chemotaxis protein [Paenibacillus phyllosphaerae]